SDADGANVQLWQDNGTPAQVWSFILSDLGKAVARNEGGAILGSGTYVLTGEGSGKVVDVAAGSYEAGARVQTYERNGTGAQSWIATVDEQGYVTLCNAQSGKVLDVRHGVGREGTPVQQYDSNGTGSQRWVALPCGAGLVSLRCALDLTLALDVRAGSLTNGATLQLYAANGTQAQAWRLEAAPAAAIAPGWHRLAPLADLTRSLDVPGGSTSAAGLQLYAANGTQAQSWWVRHLGGSSYALQASCSGLYLTDDDDRRQAPDAGARSRWGVSYAPSGGYVLTNEATGARLDLGQGVRWAALWATSGVRAGFYEVCLAANPSLRLDDEYASKTPGTRVQLWSGNGTLAQRWWLREAGGGALTLTNCNSGLELDARGANLGSGTDVRQWPRDGGATQRWLITMGVSGLELRSAAEEAVLQACGETMSAGAGVRVFEPDGSVAQSWRLAAAPAPSKIGYQNPAGHYQVSSWNVVVPGGHGIFSYASPSVIGLEATREDCVDAFVRRAYDYLGTPYVWNYSCAPGVGVDCIGLVFQCAYATGMDLGSAVYESDFNPWSHVSSGPRGWHSHDANNFWNYARAQRVPYEDLRRGDVISYAGHAAIYVGGGKMIEAYSRATGVRLTAVRPGRGCIRLFS
ncbi:RICIN domain-containing protein, partial [Olsenella sp. HMSC062G07]|uniref:RICIN domain-containing protein n=1 Tax=Olsenella sp. HMSC062G07 TaxID=1739330 RepID=UPI001AEFC4C4